MLRPGDIVCIDPDNRLNAFITMWDTPAPTGMHTRTGMILKKDVCLVVCVLETGTSTGVFCNEKFGWIDDMTWVKGL